MIRLQKQAFTFFLLLGVLVENISPVSANLKSVDDLLARGEQQQALEELNRLVRQDKAEAQTRLADWYVTGQGVQANFSMAWQWYKRAALQGYAPAQYKIGYLYQNGVGVERYIDKAAEWYEFAAKQNLFAAQVKLAAVWTEMGRMQGGKTLDILATTASRGDRQALKYLRQFADDGYQPARDMLDRLPREIRDGQSVRPPSLDRFAEKGLAAFLAGDYVSAISIFKPLADQQQTGGVFGMGLVYQVGPAILRDPDKAEDHYKKAVDQGSVDAMTNLALHYWRTMAPPNDEYMAINLLERAISKGSERAKQALALINTKKMTLQTARNIRFSIPPRPTSNAGLAALLAGDFVNAISFFKHQADEGKADGQLGLGLIYDQGIPALTNPVRAAQLYRAAAAQGYAGAQVNLGNLYFSGVGVKKNIDEAMKWYLEAASQNDPLAQNMLGYAFLTGTGKKQDITRAARMFAIASDQGNDGAMNAAALLGLGAQNTVPKTEGSTGYEISVRTAYATGLAALVSATQLPEAVAPLKSPKEFELLRAAAKLGNRAAQYNLARILVADNPQPGNLIEAYSWFTLAHHNGHKTALAEREKLGQNLTLQQRIEAEWLVASSLLPRTVVQPTDVIEAIAGAPEEQWQIGLKYRDGRGVEKDMKEAVKWFSSAALKGHPIAQRDLGTMYRRGLGVKKNDEEAAKWFRKSANQGYMKAQRDLGIAHQFGRGVPKDEAEAVRWYRKAADQGERKAQTNLAFMYKSGHGVQKDLEEAAKWYRKAADQGSRTAQKNLGVFYQFGHGVPKDEAQAAKWYRLSADQGNYKAQQNLGYLYKNGIGVKADYREAAKWYFKAATKGSARAQNVLGLMYQSGSGVRQDIGRAVQWYLKALDQRYGKTYISIDLLIKEGPQQHPAYKELDLVLRKIAERGGKRAQNSMGLIYRFGKGVKIDRIVAEKWFKMAIKQGSDEATKNLAEMKLDQS